MKKSRHHILIQCFALIAMLSGATIVAHAQVGTQLVALIDKKPIVIEAPYPFVEVSRVLPEAFAQRQRNIPAANRLIAWFIPSLDVKDQLNEKAGRYRSLQIQVMKEMEPVRYEPADLKAMQDEVVRTTSGLKQITEDDTDTLFSLLDLSTFGKKAGGQKILGLSILGENSFTLCIATSNEGRDMRGGREVEASLACVTHVLINEKILVLTVSGPELTAKELRNTMRLSREWIALLTAHNTVPITGKK